ncbi:MAG TPA: hypothetical protein DCZ80_05950, partial [Legionellales bacterium]|nr:hypothetical protein [Legionellales bacterium]
RLIYQLFNIENYAFNLIIMKLFKKFSNPFQPQEHVDGSHSSIWSSFVSLLGFFQQEEPDTLSEDLSVWRTVEPEAHNITDAPVTQVVTFASIQVNELYLSHILKLGMSKTIGDFVTYDEVKAAFKKKILVVHPDKGGSNEEFRAVKASMDFLKKVFEHQFPATPFDDPFTWLEQLEKEFKEDFLPNLELNSKLFAKNVADLEELKVVVEKLHQDYQVLIQLHQQQSTSSSLSSASL